MLEHIAWTEKYRPQNIEDCILPVNIKAKFAKMVADDEISTNFLLSGSPGTGKTTLAKAMLTEMGVDYITINGSMNGNIDTLRNEIQNFASSVSIIEGGRKAVILDEADYLNPNSTQPALRNFMEEYETNCVFILTCNLRNRIMEALQSRCSTVDFSIPAAEKEDLIKQACRRIFKILETENVEFDRRAVAGMVVRFFPDLRKTLNELQAYSKISGKIDIGVLSQNHTEIKDLIGFLKDKNFKGLRGWVAENSDLDFHLLTADLLKNLPEHMNPDAVPHLIIHISEYDYRNAFVGNKEVNTAAMLTMIMDSCF